MQNGDIYTDFNEKHAKYKELSKIVAENESLLEWKEGEMVMDVGCGPGDVTVNVIVPTLPVGYQKVVGVDISPKMTKHGLAHHANERITFETLDIGLDISEFLTNEKYSQGFTKIFSFYVLNWVKDLKKGVANLFRLLRPGGQALLMFPVNRNFQKTYKNISSREPWNQYFKDVTRTISPYLSGDDPVQEFQHLLENTGFQIVKCEIHHAYDEFESVLVLKDLIESLDQYIGCIPPELKGQYLDHCVEVMKEMKILEIKKGKALLTVSKIVAVVKTS